ncbi:winged helix-turn-helix domain-containing protein [Martelella soudanensis]|uniref:winged helix-turn-helix domain-containing protein n=1 Tax=unclassified Martelella TaxID=2629616 RepID=UPI0015E02059|nr:MULTISPECIES: winged helix-turn-helix domain-containing protein [unclassified Martelella]
MVKMIANGDARRIFLARQGLSANPGRATGKQDILKLIEQLGFVQVDSIRTVERAHDMILFSRNQTFRREHLGVLLERDRALFEHWTHDASFIPVKFYPYWKHRFRREEERLRERWRKWQGEGFATAFEETYEEVRERGPIFARELKQDDHVSGGWWNWHPAKTALEYHWRTGHFAICHRVNFQKAYDLAERVIPDQYRLGEVDHDAFVDWACRAALSRLGFATSGELAAFFALVTPQEARDWVEANADRLTDVLVETVDGGRPRAAVALADEMPSIFDVPEPPSRVRVLSPFDPLLRDRARAERLFGFSYRIEIFVPEAKRQYGYYVFPLIEGDRLIGRIDMKADRKRSSLDVRRLWLEPGVRASSGRFEKLDAELSRLARFTGVDSVNYLPGWRSEAI